MQAQFQLYKNAVITGQLEAFCLLCNLLFNNETEAYQHILLDEYHIHRYLNVKYVKEFYPDIIIKFPQGYYCTYCNVILSTFYDAKFHTEQYEHQQCKGQSMTSKDGDNILIYNDIFISKLVWNGIIENKCVICNTNVDEVYWHLLLQTHITNVLKYKCEFGDFYVYRDLENDSFLCMTCGFVISNERRPSHHFTNYHVYKYGKYRKICEDPTDINNQLNAIDLRIKKNPFIILNQLMTTEQQMAFNHKPDSDDEDSDATLCDSPMMEVDNIDVIEEDNNTDKTMQTNNSLIDNHDRFTTSHKNTKHTANVFAASDINMNISRSDNNRNYNTEGPQKDNVNSSFNIKVNKKQQGIEKQDMKPQLSNELQCYRPFAEYSAQNKEDTWCFTCECSFKTDTIELHEDTKHHKLCLRYDQRYKELRAERLRQFESDDHLLGPRLEPQKSRPPRSKLIKKRVDEEARAKVIDEYGDSELSSDDENQNKMLDDYHKYFKNGVKLDLQSQKADCSRCNKPIQFGYTYVNEHIDYHNVAAQKYIENENNKQMYSVNVDIYLYVVQCILCNFTEMTSLGEVNKKLARHVSSCKHQMKIIAEDTHHGTQLTKVPFKNYVNLIENIETFLYHDIFINKRHLLSFFSVMLLVQCEKTESHYKLHCCACNVNLTDNNVYPHINTDEHGYYISESLVVQSLENEFVRCVKSSIYHCGYCNIYKKNWFSMHWHLASVEHKVSKSKARWRLMRYQPYLTSTAHQNLLCGYFLSDIPISGGDIKNNEVD